MTDERLAELERLANAAPEPDRELWLSDPDDGKLLDTADEFYAEARTAIPELIADVRQLQEDFARMTEFRDQWRQEAARLQESLHFLQTRYDSLNLAADQYCESRDKWRMERMAYHRAVALLEPATRDLVMKWAAEDIQRYTADGEPSDATP